MIPPPFFAGTFPPQFPAWNPIQSATSSFWQSEDVHRHLRKLRETIDLAKAMKKELEALFLIKRSQNQNAEEAPSSAGELSPSSYDSILPDFSQCPENEYVVQIFKLIEAKRTSLDVQTSMSIEAVNSLASTIKYQLLPLDIINNPAVPWESRSEALRFSNKLQKCKRNKLWRKRKRKRVAEQVRKLQEDHQKADQDADEWRAREIAKDVAMHKVQHMKEIAKLKAKEERKRLESELELLLVVEKLQELRSIRVQKLKKQGHFLPEEDDKFLLRVRAAVEEEERQAAAAADTHAAKNAIATAEESRKLMQNRLTETNSTDQIEVEPSKAKGQSGTSDMDASLKSEQERDEVQGCGTGNSYDSLSNLPFEFLHYYHGSSNDMGTLIEVRRMWDAYIRSGGSHVPGHWVQPPPPSDEIWASYLIPPK
ncbi:U11/U12 small nuclear ribonucleoprotein 59 kDa protein-like isoform X2 [Zingiber officinale]|uniref:U11/U12 small nuclear ribonucleoprotein 59 kDa protein-like isoform X2 n=1 Tax=Zingiber officinale TaxID=94328 RepID=UPI001C4D5D1E|nr:U11/U12 small nuclear ribonucleoprotein 59 kDa protein-like isoform X2 [Zingiber officinale]